MANEQQMNGSQRSDEPDWLRPAPRLAVMRRAEAAVVSASAALIIAGAVSFVAGWTWAVVAFVVTIGAGALLLSLVQRRIRSWGYAERENDLLVRHGLLIQRLSVVPYGRMQFIDVTAGPVERSFGLVTVQLHTAAAASDARIPA
jgi:membrane protein YdbS with pleckstrin-like domain